MFKIKKAISFLLIVLLGVMVIGQSFAYAWNPEELNWPVSSVSYGSASGEVSTVLAISTSLCTACGFGAAAIYQGIAGTIATLWPSGWDVYFKKEFCFSPDGFAYYIKTTFYENSNYTGQIGSPVYSDVYFISCSPGL